MLEQSWRSLLQFVDQRFLMISSLTALAVSFSPVMSGKTAAIN